MFKRISATLIWSGDFKKLSQWYREKLGLKPIEEINHPDDTGIGFEVGSSYLWIGQHSKVKGKNKDCHRIMFNLEVDSVSESYKKLKNRGVEFYCAPFKAPTFDKYCATFFDSDGNMLQLIGGK